jgi:hypothetical protein
MNSLRTLARIKRFNLPPTQVNIARQQVVASQLAGRNMSARLARSELCSLELTNAAPNLLQRGEG